MPVIILKPLEGPGYEGYGIAVDGSVWSRLNTHGQITKQWSQRETYLKRKSRYVKLQVNKKTVERHVARLLLEAVFGPLPDEPGFDIRYGNGCMSDCRLVNLSFGPHPDRVDYLASNRDHHLAIKGAIYKKTIPPGFSKVTI